MRADRPGEPEPLTLSHPHGAPQTGGELPLHGSLLGSVALRVAFLGALTVFVLVFWLG